MNLDALLHSFDNGDAAERFHAACSIARRLEEGERVEHQGEQLDRADWLVYALAYAPNALATKNISLLLACA